MTDEVLERLTPLGTLECGCLVMGYDGGNVYKIALKFCPLHRAAPALLAACEALVRFEDQGTDPANYESAVSMARKALAAARQEAADE